MLYYLTGGAAFGLYAVYDINSVLWKKKLPRSFFLLGSLLLLISTAVCVGQTFFGGSMQPRLRGVRWAFLVFAGLSFGLMVYTLFFALPFSETYVCPGGQRKVFDRGMYALCRHPGVIWFCLGYLNLGLLCGSPGVWSVGIFYSMLNVAYVVFQDRWTFPRTFEDYGEYRQRVPFLVPTGKSIRQAWRTR